MGRDSYQVSYTGLHMESAIWRLVRYTELYNEKRESNGANKYN
ncbi:hypothetical protein VCRA2121O68_110102 [Vibrio crassostreae]|uniref:Uncharacterized protein n=1 Tax=Vibrio crassostreae TaxID=246167 RepID=A0ABM9QLQ5_9VIBR|nr:hypothetical protein VCRA2116O27_110051 [Vibrio crassostreae]CAK1714905.1 hypothetical protein VCRA2118O41_110051 [Vibrio crassostreae]CAK1732066.1 hypothetical protein VCRA2116O26_120051 [Vibrio crassostreae]CAK1732364.1 hypothetical protein VCRA2117O38_120051 [Vibrio crassostreae]CAK1735755.1 hypothetical protein VCRA2116O28_120104 [Vibrio crassostreae]